MGTHQGAISHKHLDYYLDEFTFRFNRRRSKSRGKLFFRLPQKAVAVDPVPWIKLFIPMQRQMRNHNLVGLPELSRYPVLKFVLHCRTKMEWDSGRIRPFFMESFRRKVSIFPTFSRIFESA